MNDVIMIELKIKFGFRDQVDLALDNSGSRILASKSFKAAERPKIHRRKPRQKTESTSSEDLPQLPRPARKVHKRQPRPIERNDGMFEKKKPKYIMSPENQYATTPENTSLSSSNSVNPSSYEQSSSESLQQKKMAALERKSRRNERSMISQIEEILKHDRLAELQRQGKPLQRHHSNKW